MLFTKRPKGCLGDSNRVPESASPSKNHIILGSSLVVQWLRLCFEGEEQRFDPLSEN